MTAINRLMGCAHALAERPRTIHYPNPARQGTKIDKDTTARELIHHVPGQGREAKTSKAHPSERAWRGSGVVGCLHFGE